MTSVPFSDYRLDEQIGFLLRKAYQRHMAICAERMEGRLTPVQFSILYRLVTEAGPVSQNALGRLVTMDAATTKGVVTRLKERGLIVSHIDAEDKRRHMLSTTEAGRALLRDLLPSMQAVTQDTLAPLEPHEQVMLLALLRKIA
ncbi:MarR family winged helix-turn-helix transcriptional regulator [Falsirhodobacter algicola]|uniref:MarR family transcriptional regulator n=1 Tax=Falsirhodobacter algicola TaxID=2692330 RepID=A0A8J8MUK8_9RHOB|nr:MarR family winged helix-turn-helix transcriptional regulator [Falsirhodobacter algicola]QUS36742.1 MarR family transcriptional regulator [Falsirhodobacter algicola]